MKLRFWIGLVVFWFVLLGIGDRAEGRQHDVNDAFVRSPSGKIVVRVTAGPH